MSALAIEGNGASTGRPKDRPASGRHGVELCLIAFFALTAAIILFQHQIFGRDIVINEQTAKRYVFSGYADSANGGKSVFTASSDPLAWSCDLKAGNETLFCGYEALFDGDRGLPGLDLRNLEAVKLVIDYHGPAPALRVHLKNDDPRYSKHGNRSTDKMNKAEFTVHNGVQTVELHPHDFSVADWWLVEKKLPPELARTQFDNIVSAEVQTGSSAPPGRYSFRIESMTLRRSLIAPAELYLVILASWAAAIVLYMVIRVRRSRHEALEKERADAEAREALAAAKETAERASRAKSEFLASMSHELRTPLNAVLGYAQLLERADLSEEHMIAIRTIHRSGRHLLSLIADILDLSKIEAGKMELHRAPANVRGAIASVVEMVRVRAEQKGLTFRCAIDEEVPDAIETDEKRLRQILLNLLSNAVKFTAEGRVSLLVSLIGQVKDTATLRFEVQDTGPGIPDEELERIFRPFEQVGDARREEGGTGLGLAISRQLASLMGATIELKSRVGQGTSFWLEATFPIPDAQARHTVVSASDVCGYVGRRRRVLVADDNTENRDLLAGLLQPLGFDIDMACDGREAVRQAELMGPDLVLMDLNMPVMDGHEAIRLIRSIERMKATPILVLSASNAEEGRVVCSGSGADGFINKPIENGELLSAIGRLLDLEWVGAPASDSEAASPPMAIAAPDQDRAAAHQERPMRILAAEDNPTNQQILRAVLQSLDIELDIVSTGVEAVAAFEAKSFDVVLMDVQMPEMSGIEATRVIRDGEAKSGRPRTPIVALSANVMAEHIAEYNAAGMDAHLEKPIEIEQLYGLLAKVSAGVLLDPKAERPPGGSQSKSAGSSGSR
jgi:signal transduction histidine kinase/DNA-binding response OmpR family regulator